MTSLLSHRDDGLPASWLAVPISSQRSDYGTLLAAYPEHSCFLPQERELLEVYARYAASALDGASALLEAESRYGQSSALLELARVLAAAGTSSEIARRLAESVPVVVDCDQVAVYVWNEAKTELVRAAVTEHLDGPAPAFDLAQLGADARLAAAVARRSPPDRSRVHRQSHRHAGASGDAAHARLRGDDHGPARLLRGAARACSPSPCATGPSAWRRPPTCSTGSPASAPRHRPPSATAGWSTSSPTRRSTTSSPAWPTAGGSPPSCGPRSRSAREQRRLAGLFYLDLDQFKPVNDELGHEAGDELLVAVAERLRDCTRAEDIVARLGGDEFAVLVSGVTEAEIDGVAERLAEAFA